MIEKPNLSRNTTSRNVRIIPEFMEKPDVEKLARALIAIAQNIGKKQLAEEKAADNANGKGEAMP